MILDFYSKLSEQEKKFLYAALAFLVLAVFDFLFFQPVSLRLKTLDKDIEQTKGDIKRDVRFLSYENQLYREDEAYRVYKTEDPKTEDEITAEFLKTIENLGTEAEVNLGKLNPGDSVPKKGYIEYFANVECNGKLENIIKYIHKIDSTRNLLKVVKMNIVSKKSSAEDVTVSLKISKLVLDSSSSAGELSDDGSGISGSAGASGKAAGAGLSGQISPGEGGTGPGISAGGEGKESKKRKTKRNGASGAGGDDDTGLARDAAMGGNDPAGPGGGSLRKDAPVRNEGPVSGNAGSGSGDGGAVNRAEGHGGINRGGVSESNPMRGSTSGNVASGGSNVAAGQHKAEGLGASGGGPSGAGSGASGNTQGQPLEGGQPGRKTTKGSSNFQVGQNYDSDFGEKTDKELAEQNKKTKDQQIMKNMKVPKDNELLDNLDTGERAQVTSLESLWNKFWGIKPKPKTDQPYDRHKGNPQEYKSEDEIKPNLWERMLIKK